MSMEKNQEESRPTRLQILFKEFSGDRFHDVAQVDTGDPAAVTSAAKELKRNEKTLLSVNLGFIRPNECFNAALSSGAYAIIVQSNNDVRMSEELKRVTVTERIEQADVLRPAVGMSHSDSN